MAGSETASPSVCIWVRTAIDWADEAALPARLEPAFPPKLELWNETFSIPYHRFRHEVCEIARLNLSRVAGATVRPWEEIPDGAIVLPVDDDWFAPDIVERLTPRLDTAAIAKRRLLGKYARYRRLYDDRALGGAEWAKPYVERMAALMAELGLRGVRVVR